MTPLLGQALTRENIVEVIKFAHREKLFIFADEVSHFFPVIFYFINPTNEWMHST